MKKMLVLFLILFTKVLADSAEDKYVDLLPDEEKQQFLEKVARRILKDVESQEGAVYAQSGELNDEQLKQHSEYVRSVLKEEQDNIRRSKGDKEKEAKPASEETNLGVKPLASLKASISNERQDLTLRKERGDSAINNDPINNLTIEVIKDNAPIIKRSVQDDDANRSNNDETVKPVEGYNLSNLNTSVSVTGVQEGSRRLNNDNSILAVTVTESTTVSAIETVKPTELKLGEINNVSVTNEEFTTVAYSFDGSSAKDNNTVATSTVGSVIESTTEIITSKYIEHTIESSLNTLRDTNNETEITKSVRTSTLNDLETVTSISETAASVTKNVPETAASVTNMAKKVPETAASVTNMAKNVPETAASVTYMTKNVPETAASVTNMTKTFPETAASVTNMTKNVPETAASVTNMTKNVPEITVDTKIVRTETATDSTTFMITEQTTESTVPVDMTKDKKIIVEDFPSASTVSAIKESIKLKPKKSIKKNELPKELTTSTPDSEKSIELTTKKPITHKIFVHKPSKHIVGPKAKKLAGTADKDDEQNKNFIELQKVYYNNNDKVKVGKEYHVFEVPAGQSPFIRNKETATGAEQPYFVPIYNYSPNNAYYNPKNRLGPNPGDSSKENIFNDDDNSNQADRTETLNVKMEYDSLSNIFGSKRKKFGSKHKHVHTVSLQPLQNMEPKVIKGQVNPEDYLDSDYYFGRVRKLLLRKANEDFNKFPNSDETDHPAHSIQEGSLKDHVRAVRNILFHQKSFGLLEKDKYDSIEHELGLAHKRSEDEEENTVLRKGPYGNIKTANDDKKKTKVTKVENKIASDYYSGRVKQTVVADVKQDSQKLNHLKKQIDTKASHVMDVKVKDNNEKYMHEKTLTTVTPSTKHDTQTTGIDKRKEIIALLRLEERKHKSEKNQKNDNKRGIETKKDINIKTNGKPEKVIDLKVNVRRNDVVKVSVYLQVLNDMVMMDSKALVQYDWLGTTVDIQASLRKLFELTALVVTEEDVHPADMEILKYVLFLNKLASEIMEANNFGTQIRNKLSIPRSKKKQRKARLQEDQSLINKVWLYLRKEVPEINEQGALKQLNSFLMDIEDSLYDLHDAIKNIAKITKYKNQHWYQNLKDLYTNTDEKHLLELLLHMSALRLFSLIETSANEGLEDDFIEYMKNNRKHCKQTLAEMMFVMELLEEYNKFVE